MGGEEPGTANKRGSEEDPDFASLVFGTGGQEGEGVVRGDKRLEALVREFKRECGGCGRGGSGGGG